MAPVLAASEVLLPPPPSVVPGDNPGVPGIYHGEKGQLIVNTKKKGEVPGNST